ncbi:OmpH family outer membrane protein [Desulfogranum japonicum]|uniref:OmpH family outer membrane protein n=1 Tax=Desulfogranum japonicum TaxID=231447 RepID=UPI00040ACADA|nr:OmpH family outer membrane protein [Desulfogranum japonicum]
MIYNKMIGALLCTILALGVQFPLSQAQAADLKIGIIDMQRVVVTSTGGKKAQEIVNKRMKELQGDFKKDEDALLGLQKEIEKKSSAWSDEMKQEKANEFRKMRRDLMAKQEDANVEIKQLREENLGPILQELQKVVSQLGEKEGYTLILPRQAAIHVDKEIDLTDKVIKALNEASK